MDPFNLTNALPIVRLALKRHFHETQEGDFLSEFQLLGGEISHFGPLGLEALERCYVPSIERLEEIH